MIKFRSLLEFHQQHAEHKNDIIKQLNDRIERATVHDLNIYTKIILHRSINEKELSQAEERYRTYIMDLLRSKLHSVSTEEVHKIFTKIKEHKQEDE
jgi:hypothetical protein